MEAFTKVSSIKIRLMDSVYIHGMTDLSMKVNGAKVSCMVKELSSTRMV